MIILPFRMLSWLLRTAGFTRTAELIDTTVSNWLERREYLKQLYVNLSPIAFVLVISIPFILSQQPRISTTTPNPQQLTIQHKQSDESPFNWVIHAFINSKLPHGPTNAALQFICFGIASTCFTFCCGCCQDVAQRMTTLKRMLDWHCVKEQEITIKLMETTNNLKQLLLCRKLLNHLQKGEACSGLIDELKLKRSEFISSTAISGMLWLYAGALQINLFIDQEGNAPGLYFATAASFVLALRKVWVMPEVPDPNVLFLLVASTHKRLGTSVTRTAQNTATQEEPRVSTTLPDSPSIQEPSADALAGQTQTPQNSN